MLLTQAGGEDGSNMEFPTTNLYELEGRVFTDTWSIPYKRDESLGKCLISAAKLAEEGKKIVLQHLIIITSHPYHTTSYLLNKLSLPPCFCS